MSPIYPIYPQALPKTPDKALGVDCHNGLSQWRTQNRRGMTVGKAAENEQIKLLATFCNNVAVAIFVAGVIVPYFALYRPIFEFLYALAAGVEPLPSLEGSVVWPATGIAVLAFAVAMLFRQFADYVIRDLQD